MMDLKYFSVFFIAPIFIFLSSCKTENDPNKWTSEFILQPGFQIELVAAEPSLESPVAMQFDKKGRIWVVELTGYMRDIDGSDEDLPDGKIVILSDEDRDGQMDSRKVFLDNLLAPRTLTFAYGGLLYSNGTGLWWSSIKNDQPSEEVLVDSLYVIGGNIEHQPNGLLYHLDNWVYSAKSNARYRRINGQWVKEATTMRGQWGLAQDDAGRLFYNTNSDPLVGDFVMPNVLIKNPFQEIKYGLLQRIAHDFRVFPFQATTVNRGYEKGVLDEKDRLTTFTSACGPTIYRGGQFPKEYYGNAFVCGPEANLIKRYLLEEDGAKITAKLAYEGEEFLVSKDETFRPVNLYTGWDDALYVVDLRKGVIQHRAYMTNYLREKILEKGLEKTSGIGRIYKINFNENPNKKIKPLDFSAYEPADYLPLLKNKNGELRMLAQKEIIFSNDISLKNDLVKVALDHEHPLGQIHAVWALEGLGVLDSIIIQKIAQATDKEIVKEQLMRLIALLPVNINTSIALIEKEFSNNNRRSNMYLSHLVGLSKNENQESNWIKLANIYKNSPPQCEALISGISGREEYLIIKLDHLKKDSIYSMLSQVIANKKNNEIKAPQLLTETFLDDRTSGFKLYSMYCVSCHGQDGKGVNNLAPPLYPSEYVTGPPEKMILIALQGLKGPVTVNGENYDMNLVMPGIKNNPDLTDEKIADLMIFIRNSFASEALGFPKPISPGLVKKMRASLVDKEELFTVEDLEEWMEKMK